MTAYPQHMIIGGDNKKQNDDDDYDDNDWDDDDGQISQYLGIPGSSSFEVCKRQMRENIFARCKNLLIWSGAKIYLSGAEIY